MKMAGRSSMQTKESSSSIEELVDVDVAEEDEEDYEGV
jgi:hypothetical protein